MRKNPKVDVNRAVRASVRESFAFFASSDNDDDDNEAGEDEKAGESLVLQTLMRWTAALSQR